MCQAETILYEGRILFENEINVLNLILDKVYRTSLGMIVSKEDWNSSMSQAVVEAAHIINKVRTVLS
jgi:hypothetical protein